MLHSKEDSNKSEHYIAQLKHLISSGSQEDYHLFFKQSHEADIAEALEELSLDEQRQFFTNINIHMGATIIEEMSLEKQIDLISQLKLELAAQFVEEMDTDDAVDLMAELKESDDKKATQIFEALSPKEADEIQDLLSYPADSAGTLMTTEFISIPEHLTVRAALDHIKKKGLPETEASFYIFIVDTQGRLTSFITLRDLILAQLKDLVQSIRHEFPIFAHLYEDQEKVAQRFQKYNLTVMPVVNDQNLLMGIITVDDVVDVVVQEASEDLLKLTGTSELSEEKLLTGPLLFSIKSRIPWLLLTIFGGVLSSYIIVFYSQLYSPTLFPLALSLSFLPLLMGLGGNIGNQSATIIVRGLATGLLKEKKEIITVVREVTVGFCIGFFIAFSLFIINYFIFHHSLLFSLLVSFCLVLNIFSASLIGSSLPLVLNRLNIDPAVASAPFISSTLDLLGQIIYFSTTLWILSFFMH